MARGQDGGMSGADLNTLRPFLCPHSSAPIPLPFKTRFQWTHDRPVRWAGKQSVSNAER